MTNSDADQELAQLLASAHLNWICGREVTKDNAGEVYCVRITRADRDRIIDALASREAAGNYRARAALKLFRDRGLDGYSYVTTDNQNGTLGYIRACWEAADAYIRNTAAAALTQKGPANG